MKTKRVNELRVGDVFFDEGVEYRIESIQKQGIYFSVWGRNVINGSIKFFFPWSNKKLVTEP